LLNVPQTPVLLAKDAQVRKKHNLRNGKNTKSVGILRIYLMAAKLYSYGMEGRDAGINLEVDQMSMFQDPRDEDKLCQVLKAYVEEWGPENVIVSVPEHWSEYSTSTLGRVRLEFSTENTVSIRVEYETVRLIYDVQLQAA
jgi:hypothetical protein